ncbi:hypothetical protein SLL00_04935 [Metabacillus indicus]|uniref:hypothetical protein n=1 Tax=Metabacillus indicus TaxID=246786 RepID=UPI002A0850EF|nr:hypothetical protein [Metabacillus indicus]MDX8289122.1 hypothetical protein [Metabacillus indicus]
MNSTQKILELEKVKPKLCSDIKKVMRDINSTEKENNLYQLFNEGLSIGIIENLIQAGISYHQIPMLLLNEDAKAKFRETTLNKIIDAFDSVEKNKGSVSYSEILNYTSEYIYNLNFNQSITIVELRDTLTEKYNLNTDEILNRIIIDLQTAKKIKYTSIGIKKHVYTLMEYLKNDFDNKELFLMRLEGKSFQQLATRFGYSRQGSLNVFKRVMAKLPTLEEEYKYGEIFSHYHIEEELFCNLYDEVTIVYNFLDNKFEKQEKRCESILDNYQSMNFNDKQKDYILAHYNCFITSNGEIKEFSKINIFNEVLKKFHYEKMRNEDILVRYNDYVIKNNFPDSLKGDINSIRGMAERNNFIIRCKSNYFRYYDFDVIEGHLLKKIKELMLLERGVYSTKKLFNENSELMKDLDIRTEYELHNLLRRYINTPQVKFTRMPEFSIGKVTKKEFILEHFNELAPIEFNDFLDYIQENFGLRKDSLASYIMSELSQYVHNDFVRVDYKMLTDDKILELKKILIEPIYTVEQFKSIGLNIEKNFNAYVNNMNLAHIGFTLRSNYVLSNKYSSVEDYFKSHILSYDYFIHEDLPIYRNQIYSIAVSKLEKSFDIIKVEKDMYITSMKLREAGIFLKDILNYRDKVLEFIQDDIFFTLKSLRDLGFDHFIEEFGFEDIFYERMISRFEGISTIRLAVGYIFKLSENQISLTDFIYQRVAAHKVVNLCDLTEELKIHYGLVLDNYKIISSVNDVEIFYSEELQRFYLDVDDYYMEVFS